MMILLNILVFTSILTTINSSNFSNSATLLLSTNINRPLVIKIRNSQCSKCKMIELAQLSAIANVTVDLDTYYPEYYFNVAESETSKEHCLKQLRDPIRFGENASYYFQIIINESNANWSLCSFSTLIENKIPLFLPLYITIGVLLGFNFIYVFCKCLFKRYSNCLLKIFSTRFPLMGLCNTYNSK